MPYRKCRMSHRSRTCSAPYLGSIVCSAVSRGRPITTPQPGDGVACNHCPIAAVNRRASISTMFERCTNTGPESYFKPRGGQSRSMPRDLVLLRMVRPSARSGRTGANRQTPSTAFMRPIQARRADRGAAIQRLGCASFSPHIFISEPPSSCSA